MAIQTYSALGKTLTLSQWSLECGIAEPTLRARIKKFNWSIEKSVSTSSHANKKRTHCKHGHKFTIQNTYRHKSNRGRTCKECMRQYRKRIYQKNKIQIRKFANKANKQKRLKKYPQQLRTAVKAIEDLSNAARFYSAFGRKQLLHNWANEYNIGLDTLRYRVLNKNMSMEKALTMQGHGNAKIHFAFNKRKPLPVWAKEYNIALATLHTRLRLGWPLEKALTKSIRKQSQNWRK